MNYFIGYGYSLHLFLIAEAQGVDNTPMIIPTTPPYINGAVLRSSIKPKKKPMIDAITPIPSVKARALPIISIAYFVASDISLSPSGKMSLMPLYQG